MNLFIEISEIMDPVWDWSDPFFFLVKAWRGPEPSQELKSDPDLVPDLNTWCPNSDPGKKIGTGFEFDV